MPGDNHLEWRAEYVPPGRRAMLQDFGNLDASAELRITLRGNQEAKVKVNNRVITRTMGFQQAAAMAEIYSRDREILLTAERPADDGPSYAELFHHVQPTADGFAVRIGATILDLAYRLEDCAIARTAPTLQDALAMAATSAGDAIYPAFLDQREIYEALPRQDWIAMVIAIWTAHWQLDFADVLKEPEALQMASPTNEEEGAYYTIYRVTCGNYLAEIKSPDRADRIGEYPTTAAARAQCAIHNAARHADKRARVATEEAAVPSRILDGAYLIKPSDDGKVILSDGGSTAALGRFDNAKQAEIYALVHKQAISHFRAVAVAAVPG